MKKFLLLFAMALLGVSSALAVTDGQTYAEKNGLNCVNVWSFDRIHSGAAAVTASPGFSNTKARTATVLNGVVYVAHSEYKTVVVDGDTTVQGTLNRYNVNTGEYIGDLDLTLDGQLYGGALLSCNQVGADNFGHLWLIPYTSEKTADVPIYQVNTETGALTLIATVSKGDAVLRVDFYDLVGDITRTEAECTVMAASTGDAIVYRWHAAKGGNFTGGFGSDPYYKIQYFYPESCTQWSYGPVVKISLGSDESSLYSGDFYYVDGFQSAPALYDATGSLLDSFEGVDSELFPEAGCNGCGEFNIGGRDFIYYAKYQYDGAGHGCQTNICEFGDEMSFTGMQKYWQVPADSLGKTSDTGVRSQSYSVWKTTEDGAEVVNFFTFKCYNGMGLWKIGTKVSGVADVETEKTVKAVSYFNLAGQQAAEPFEGVNVVRTTYTDGTVKVDKVLK